MDTRGAVDLSLAVSEVTMTDPRTLPAGDIERWAHESAYGMPTKLWTRIQLTRLAAASVLQARLLHVKASRLEVFNLVRDPERVTLQQLAPLQLVHRGTAGQAFEIAVADAVNRQRPEVTDPIRAGLRLLNLTAEEPLRMIVLGLEKVPIQFRSELWADVRAALPDNGKMRTGMRGRPANVETVISKLAAMSAADMQRPRTGPDRSQLTERDRRDRDSQLGRADALLACGADLVAVSLKINRRASRDETWRAVPLWITVGPEAVARPWSASGYGPRQSPRVSVELASQGWFALFRDALDAVDLALDQINRDRAISDVLLLGTASGWDSPTEHVPVPLAVAQTMWQLRRETVSQVVAELQRVHPGLREAAGAFALGQDQVQLNSLNVPAALEGWATESEEARLFQAQTHLFRPLHPYEQAEMARVG